MAIEKLNPIKIFQGASSEVDFDFTNFEFAQKQVILTVKEKDGKTVLFSHIFTTPTIERVRFQAKDTVKFNSNKEYVYDLMLIENEDNRFPLCLPTEIIVDKVVGSYGN